MVMRSAHQDRRCDGCGTHLARDNYSRRCSPCARREVQASSAPIKPDEFWQRPTIREALDARHIGQVINAYRHEHRPVLTQAKVGRWLDLTQGQVSRLELSAQPTHDLNKLDQWARALHTPSAIYGSSYRNNRGAHTPVPELTITSNTSPGRKARTCNDGNCCEPQRPAPYQQAVRRSAGSVCSPHRGQARVRWV